jgi:hypothetical protein
MPAKGAKEKLHPRENVDLCVHTGVALASAGVYTKRTDVNVQLYESNVVLFIFPSPSAAVNGVLKQIITCIIHSLVFDLFMSSHYLIPSVQHIFESDVLVLATSTWE